MKAIILAAGLSSRLRPFTEQTPKGILPIGNSTTLDRLIGILRSAGIDDIAMVIGYKADVMREHFKASNITFIENTEYQSTNNTFSLWSARDFVRGSEDGFVVANSDLIFKPEMLQALLDSPIENGMVIDRETYDPSSDMVKVQLDGDRILQMSKTLDTSIASAEALGPVKFSQEGGRKYFEQIGGVIEDGNRNEWFFYSLSNFASRTPFYGVQNPGLPWAEIDTPEDLEKARMKVESGVL